MADFEWETRQELARLERHIAAGELVSLALCAALAKVPDFKARLADEEGSMREQIKYFLQKPDRSADEDLALDALTKAADHIVEMLSQYEFDAGPLTTDP